MSRSRSSTSRSSREHRPRCRTGCTRPPKNLWRHLDPEINAVVLLDEVKYTIVGGDDIVERYRRVVKIVRNEGREEGRLSVWVGQQGKVLSIHAWSVDKSGREYELKEKDFAERSPYSYVLYEDVRLRTAQAPASDPGSVIALEYEVRRKAWIKELNWFFQEENPVREARLILQMPSGWEYRESWAAASPVQPEPSPEGGLQWTVRDVPPVKREPRMPAFLSISGQMELSYFGPGTGETSAKAVQNPGRLSDAGIPNSPPGDAVLRQTFHRRPAN